MIIFAFNFGRSNLGNDHQHWHYIASLETGWVLRKAVWKPPRTGTKGLQFEACFEKAEVHQIDGIRIRVLHIDDLIKAKKASNRSKDQDDIENLTST